MLRFKKVNANHYLVENAELVAKQVMEALAIITSIASSEYETNNNNTIIDMLSARYISSEFFAQKLPIGDLGFVVVEASVFGEIIKVSVGTIKINEQNKKLSGVLYEL